MTPAGPERQVQIFKALAARQKGLGRGVAASPQDVCGQRLSDACGHRPGQPCRLVKSSPGQSLRGKGYRYDDIAGQTGDMGLGCQQRGQTPSCLAVPTVLEPQQGRGQGSCEGCVTASDGGHLAVDAVVVDGCKWLDRTDGHGRRAGQPVQTLSAQAQGLATLAQWYESTPLAAQAGAQQGSTEQADQAGNGQGQGRPHALAYS